MIDQKIVMVLAPPRSGSSFTASWLAKCGLDLGGNLKPADDVMNEKGFFEDLGVIDFHENIVKRHRKGQGSWRKLLAKLYIKGYTFSRFNKSAIREEDFWKARTLVQQFREQHPQQWGWKLSYISYYWNALWWPVFTSMQLTSQLCLLILVRDYTKMVDSIIRSEVLYLEKKKNIWYAIQRLRYQSSINERANFWLTEWLKSYTEILLFLEQHPTFRQYLIVDVPTLLNNSKEVYTRLTEGHGIAMQYINPNELYEQSLMDRRLDLTYTFDAKLVEQADQVQTTLLALMRSTECSAVKQEQIAEVHL